MADAAVSLARRARRTAIIQALRGRPELTIEQLHELLDSEAYGEDLRGITVRELLRARSSVPTLEVQPDESIEDAILRVFQRLPRRELASGFFCRYMGLERWTAQKLLAELAERGLLVRMGKTSGTRYRLVSR